MSLCKASDAIEKPVEELFALITRSGKFSQINDTGDIMTGNLYLKKPGKIRFSYDNPDNLQIVSKQQALLIFDPKNSGSGPLTYPLSSTPLTNFAPIISKAQVSDANT